MAEIQWQNPPTAKAGRGLVGELKEFAQALRNNPKQWALMPGGPKSSAGIAYNIRAGKYASFGSGFDATSRAVGSKKFDIYVRYVGDGEATR